MAQRIGVPENRQIALNQPLLSPALLAYIPEYKWVDIIQYRLGPADIMELNESRWESRNLTKKSPDYSEDCNM